ncbi:BET1-like protein isoform X1 [Phyllostomus discolor]|uniref:BET1-like protein n=1 Tax=Phyllostomus discolor TaxID=89673 RepID=A0A7E6E3F8_9CHIR|nr:BET1-like protein isoform X1 [Phyllostomus discolor]
MQQAFVERLWGAEARSARSERPRASTPTRALRACARLRPRLPPLCPAGKGPTQPAPVSRVPGADQSDARAPGAHRQSRSTGPFRCPPRTPARPQPEVDGPRRKGRRRKLLRGTLPRRGRLRWIRRRGGRGQHDGRLVSGLSPPAAQSSGAVEEILDRENLRMADSLASKVTRLKALALDIDRDAEDQNRYLDGMDSDFSSVTGLLTGSVKRFSTMARSGRDNRKLLCGVAMGLIVVFFILSYFLSRART